MSLRVGVRNDPRNKHERNPGNDTEPQRSSHELTLTVFVFLRVTLVDRFTYYVEVLVDSDAHPDYRSNAD